MTTVEASKPGAAAAPAAAGGSANLSSSTSEILFWGSFAHLAILMVVSSQVALPVLFQMASYTSSIIYIGSHLSLKQREVDPTTGARASRTDTLNKRDAMLFPFIGSAALLSLYLAYKFLPSYWVNMLLTIYLGTLGCVALAECLLLFTDRFLPSKFQEVLVTFSHPWIGEMKLTVGNILSYVLGGVIGMGWVYSKHWMLHNALAVGFCIQAIRFISVGSFSIATILLAGLFVYDIFWVFGTEVMVTVAKSFEAPAKIIFPVSLSPWQQSILGLGDVVIPGIFVAMVLRFDCWLAEGQQVPNKQSLGVDIHQKFGKFFFWCQLVAYQIGLLTTGIVMTTFSKAQPALLYLVPSCLLGLYAPAWITGHLVEVCSYTEEDEEEEKDKQEGETEKEKHEEAKKEK